MDSLITQRDTKHMKQKYPLLGIVYVLYISNFEFK